MNEDIREQLFNLPEDLEKTDQYLLRLVHDAYDHGWRKGFRDACEAREAHDE